MMTVERLQALHDVWGEDAAWRARAACAAAVRNGEATVDTFFPARGDHDAVNRALAICAGCPVHDECLEYAVAHFEKDGIWGATAGRRRRKLKSERRRENVG